MVAYTGDITILVDEAHIDTYQKSTRAQHHVARRASKRRARHEGLRHRRHDFCFGRRRHDDSASASAA